MRDRINFTAEIASQSCNYLDLTIYKSPSFQETGLLSTTIYYKPTNTFSFPLNTSYIPAHIHKGIAIGEMTRIIRNTTSPTICDIYKKRLIKRLKRRGYNKKILRSIGKMKHESRASLLEPRHKQQVSERRIPFCIKFAKCHPKIHEIFARRWSLMYNDFRLMTLFPDIPFPIFTSRKKIKSILSKKRHTYDILPSEPNLAPNKAKAFNFLKFNCPRPTHRIP